MDIKQEYGAAFELASTGRYSEARVKLLDILQHRPDRIDTLLLLGKVEYYLKRYQDSRARFETVLNYEPGNFAAYFGLEYYNERTRRIRFYIAMLAAFIFFSAAVGFLYFSLRGVFREQVGTLQQTVTRQSRQLKAVKESIVKTGQQGDKEILNDLGSLERVIDSLDKEMKRLKAGINILKKEQKRILRYLKIILERLPQKGEKNGAARRAVPD